MIIDLLYHLKQTTKRSKPKKLIYIVKILYDDNYLISLKIFLAGLRLGLKNPQVGEKWVSDDGFCFRYH
jgi:heme-binding NEAT domain protein